MEGINLSKTLPLLSGNARWKLALRKLLGTTLSVDAANQVLTPPPQSENAPHLWFEERLAALQIQLKTTQSSITPPTSGPLLWVANHPFGGVDPMCLMAIALRHRLDTKIIGNEVANSVIGSQPYTIPVDILSNQSAQTTQTNSRPLLNAARHLRSKGQLLLFPSGIVAHASHPFAPVKEGQWISHLGSLLRLSEATVIPVKFEGANSPLFHAAGWIHPFLRTALLPHEFIKRRETTVTAHIGAPIDPASWSQHSSDEAISAELRRHTLELS